MARDFNGSTGTISSGSTPVTAAPCTMACWFNPDSDSATGTLMCSGDTGSINDCLRLDAAGAVSGDPVRAMAIASTTNAPAVTTAGYTTAIWQHAAAVFESSTLRHAFLNGGNKGTDTTSCTPTSLDRIAIGCTFRSSAVQYFDGRIAEAAIWNVALTDDEIFVLSLGFCPLLIRPDNLVAYWPILGRVSPEHDLVGGYNMTLFGTANVADHCRIIRPNSLSRTNVLRLGATVSPSVLALLSSLPGYTASGGSLYVPSEKSLVTNLITPVTTGGSNFDAAAQAVVTSLPASTVTTGSNHDATAQVVTVSAQDPTISADGTYGADTQGLTVNINAVDAVGGAEHNVGVNTVIVTAQSPSVVGGSSYDVLTQSILVTTQAPTATGGAEYDALTQLVVVTTNTPDILLDDAILVGVVHVNVTTPTYTVVGGSTHAATPKSVVVNSIDPVIDVGVNFSANAKTITLIIPTYRINTGLSTRPAGCVCFTLEPMGRVDIDHDVQEPMTLEPMGRALVSFTPPVDPLTIEPMGKVTLKLEKCRC